MIVSDKFTLNETDRYALLIMGAIFAGFLSVYIAYSAGKFKALKARSLIKSNVVMKVIQHNVHAVCPRCGSKGIPLCPVCKVPMFWNGYVGTFVCPACGKTGFPACPRCKELMSWVEVQ
ncbi:MAG: hypothetical protein HQL16_05865 [Candidatus Omnitrophica bacterium]|nr:hypothetical protein [Candidatus Omnitrophota bacterium]